jgi:hypothetical protein
MTVLKEELSVIKLLGEELICWWLSLVDARGDGSGGERERRCWE